jgi:hypothetical protein
VRRLRDDGQARLQRVKRAPMELAYALWRYLEFDGDALEASALEVMLGNHPPPPRVKRRESGREFGLGFVGDECAGDVLVGRHDAQRPS